MEFKENDIIIAKDLLGDKIGYYISTEDDKWVYFSSKKNGHRAVYVRLIQDVRLATKEEINTLNG